MLGVLVAQQDFSWRQGPTICLVHKRGNDTWIHKRKWILFTCNRKIFSVRNLLKSFVYLQSHSFHFLFPFSVIITGVYFCETRDVVAAMEPNRTVLPVTGM
ncbi:hypothetical protein XENTR_v10020266 [Xenopus tropicalis]|nr:hypothetical protein XENTR_v10020223 [Xenopus tropicalis]KAE8582779.1 hypothetical protein XENTR_v10020266 [Xenopus tropicalis]